MKTTKPLMIFYALLIAAVLSLLVPFAIYFWEFNGELSDSHTRWSEFGGFIGGIYSPIIAFLTLSLLALQTASQISFNKHQIDQNFTNRARSEIDSYLGQLINALQKHESISNVPLSQSLLGMFGKKTLEELEGAICAIDVKRISMTEVRISALWSSIYTVFIGLKAVDETEYKMAFESSKMKCISLLSYELCVALDNYHYVATNYPKTYVYEFARQKL